MIKVFSLKNGIGAFLAATLVSFAAGAQTVTLSSSDLTVGLSPKGFYESVKVAGDEVLSSSMESSLVTACRKGSVIMPSKLVRKGNDLVVTMTDGKTIVLETKQTPLCMTLVAKKVPADYDAVTFGPLKVNIHEVVGEVVGVVQGRGVAIGFQALNPKTIPGLPQEYAETYIGNYGGKGSASELSVGTIQSHLLAATDVADGAVFQFACRNRSREEKRKVLQLPAMEVLPVKGADALIDGAGVAIFGCRADQALQRIGEIEVEQGLPHPMIGGEWGKTARKAMCSYLITDVSDRDLDFILDKADIAGFKYIYHPGPFEDWGHFNWSKSFVESGDDAGVKALVDRGAKRGVSVGVHTLSNFTTTNDAYVSPVPSKNLLRQGTLSLLSDLDASQNEIRVKKSDLFSVPLTLNALMIDDELITFGSAEDDGDATVMKNCQRGAFGTRTASHKKQTPLYKLWDYPYRTLFPDMELQQAYSKRLAEIFSSTGLKQISFDGLEGCTYTGHEEYAPALFVDQFFKGVSPDVINDASRLGHYTWHIHTRMNWGEPWGEAMRTGQVENRIKNQAYFKRNLFPRMLGWFLIRLADRKFECSSLEDLEWALSESAGFDSGYAMNIGVNTLRNHGQIDRLLQAIHDWDTLRENQCFTPEQMERLKDPATEWHLERAGEGKYLLYPLAISKYFNCMLSELQPGQPGGADWSVTTPYEGKYAIRLKVDGDGEIRNPRFVTDRSTIVFPCTVAAGQYLLYGMDGTASVTDKNYNVVSTVTPQGSAAINAGDNHVAFSCETVNGSSPDVSVRFITRGVPEQINCK